MKTREQVDELKTQWESDPCWDIEDTEGFEDYADELREYRAICEYQWREERAEQGQSTALQQAQAAWQMAQKFDELYEAADKNAYFRNESERSKQDAATLAAIAQAEALTRIAEVLETMLDDQTHERTQRLRALAQRNVVHVAAEELGL